MALILVFLTSGTTFVCPNDWNPANNFIDTLGAGGAGAGTNSGKVPSGAGGGWSRKNNVNLIPGNSYTYNVGAAGVAVLNGDGGDGGDTWFGHASYASALSAAKGGTGGKKTGLVVGVGGDASLGIGDLKYSGGQGYYNAGQVCGFGGGGAAGPNGDGLTAVGPTGAGADAGFGGAPGAPDAVGLPGGNGTEYNATHGSGAGGGGPASSSNLQPGAGGLYGGGGAGCRVSVATKGGEGSPGLIVLGYDAPISYGDSAVTIANFGVAETGLLGKRGAHAQTIDNFGAAGAGTLGRRGTHAQTIDNFGAAGAGTLGRRGDHAQTIANFGSTETGSLGRRGDSSVTIANFGASAAGGVTLRGASAVTIANFGAAAHGGPVVTGASARTMANFGASAAGGVVVHGASAQTMGNFGNLFEGARWPRLHGDTNVTMGNFGGMFTGVVLTEAVNLFWPADLLAFYIEPNWQSDYNVTLEFLTDIVTSRYGREQRRALRQTPRKTLEFDTLQAGDNGRTFNRTMRAWQGKRFMIADHTKYFVAALPANSASLTVDPIPDWVRPGVYMFLKEQDSDDVETRVVLAASGTTVSFGNTSSREWSEQTFFYRGQRGRTQAEMETTWPTNDASTLQLTFSVEPGSESWLDPGLPVQTHRDIEVFTMSPNWRTDLTATLQTNVEMLDFNYGTISYYEPQPFRRELWKGNFAGPSVQTIDAVTKFFSRMFGRRGSFYAPTWRDDIPLAAPISTWDFQILAKGREIYDLLLEDPMIRDIAIIDTDFVIHTYRIGDIELSGDDTLLQLTDLIPPGLDLLFVSWLSRWRFGSDTLTFAYASSDVAEFDMSFLSVESDDP